MSDQEEIDRLRKEYFEPRFETVKEIARDSRESGDEIPPKLEQIAKDAAPMSFDELVGRICKPRLQPARQPLINVKKAYEDYAAATGKHPITREDKLTAILEHVLRYSRYRWGLRELHPLSFGAGFLLSSLFWLTIGIALQIISR